MYNCSIAQCFCQQNPVCCYCIYRCISQGCLIMWIWFFRIWILMQLHSNKSCWTALSVTRAIHFHFVVLIQETVSVTNPIDLRARLVRTDVLHDVACISIAWRARMEILLGKYKLYVFVVQFSKSLAQIASAVKIKLPTKHYYSHLNGMPRCNARYDPNNLPTSHFYSWVKTGGGHHFVCQQPLTALHVQLHVYWWSPKWNSGSFL